MSTSIDTQRKPYIIACGVSCSVPVVAHKDVRRLRGAGELVDERRLRVVRVGRFGSNISTATPRAREAGGPVQLVRIGSVAGLA